MESFGLAITLSIIAALFFAGVVAITHHGSRYGKLVAYVGCLIIAAAPAFGRYVVAALVAAAVVLVIAGIIGNREQSRLR